MGFEQTWRWFGTSDPISLKEIKQTGAAGIVTALHQVPVGDTWTIDEIEKRKNIIEAEGLKWSVVESLPVHENIKKQKDNYLQLIENYKISIRNLGKCGIDTICYNFMPVLDWSRTDLNVVFKDGSITTKFEMNVFAAFDLFILKRKNAEKDYSENQIKDAEKYYKNLTENQRENLLQTILLGLPGSGETITLEQLRSAINEYSVIDKKKLQENLFFFLKEIIPAAEDAGVFMAIHPDDPPKSLLGLPRITGSKDDIQKILDAYKSAYNGITFCTGSLGAGFYNDINDMVNTFASNVNFVHLRNVKRNEEGDFIEDNHLEGDVDLYHVVKALLIEQNKRIKKGDKNSRMPMRPDHGHLMLDDQTQRKFYPGYSLYGRMRGLAELRGLELGIIRSLDLN